MSIWIKKNQFKMLLDGNLELKKILLYYVWNAIIFYSFIQTKLYIKLFNCQVIIFLKKWVIVSQNLKNIESLKLQIMFVIIYINR